MNKKNSKQVIQSAREQMADSFKLPKDFVLGASMLSVTGCREAYIENYKGMIECCGDCVIVQTKTCRIQFEGCNLSVDYYTDEEMKLTGCIKQINFYE